MQHGMALLAFLIVATAIAASMMVGAMILRVRARRESPLKRLTYECGEAPTGTAWMRFHARYYIVALFFVLFDLEAAFLFPWATIVRGAGTTGLIAVVSFVVILMLGWVWAIRKGAIRWQ